MYSVSLLEETTTYCNRGTIRYGMYTRGVRKQRAKRGEARREEREGIYMTMATQFWHKSLKKKKEEERRRRGRE